MNIALVNEIAMFARDLGIDVWQAIDAASTKPFGYMRFTRDPASAATASPSIRPTCPGRCARCSVTVRFVELANGVNEHMPDYVVRRLMLAMNARRKGCRGSRIVLLGLAYKKNTGDARGRPPPRSPSSCTAWRQSWFSATPHVRDSQVPHYLERAELTADLVDDADAVILLTDHDAFDYSLLEHTTTYVLDTRRRLSNGTARCL